jgi:hypothetical protein
VRYDATVAHLQCVMLPDGKTPKFKFIKPTVHKGIGCGLFEWHPELWSEVKRFCEVHDLLRETTRNKVRRSALRIATMAKGE